MWLREVCTLYGLAAVDVLLYAFGAPPARH